MWTMRHSNIGMFVLNLGLEGGDDDVFVVLPLEVDYGGGVRPSLVALQAAQVRTLVATATADRWNMTLWQRQQELKAGT